MISELYSSILSAQRGSGFINHQTKKNPDNLSNILISQLHMYCSKKKGKVAIYLKVLKQTLPFSFYMSV